MGLRVSLSPVSCLLVVTSSSSAPMTRPSQILQLTRFLHKTSGIPVKFSNSSIHRMPSLIPRIPMVVHGQQAVPPHSAAWNAELSSLTAIQPGSPILALLHGEWTLELLTIAL